MNDDIKDLEAQKLRLEIEDMARPKWRRPGFLISILSVLLGASTAAGQYVFSKQDYQLAEIERAKAELEKKEAEEAAAAALRLWEEYQAKIAAAKEELERIKVEQLEVESLIAEGLNIITDGRPGIPDPSANSEKTLGDLEGVLKGIDKRRVDVNQRIQAQQQQFNETPEDYKEVEKWANKRMMQQSLPKR